MATAAECFNEAAGIPRGRLRGWRRAERLQDGFNEAAGIPRGRRARAGRSRPRRRPASMRPRVFPAETAAECFNEAAGIPRGRRVGAADAATARASMRPRVFPAETHALAAREPRPCASMRPRVRKTNSFNEAAGIPRGRQKPGARRSKGPRGFNEAAGIPRGRHTDFYLGLAPTNNASMRPRVFPAEDRGSGSLQRLRLHASMRPRVFPAEDVVAGPVACAGNALQ